MPTELRSSDFVAVAEQLGREPTTSFTVWARCSGGHPLVIRNAPYDAAGDPFPTTYWLTCPEVVRAVSRLEADGWIGRFNQRYEEDAEFALRLEEAHRAYAAERASGGSWPEAREWGGVAGTRVGVKCLHGHFAYWLAGGDDPVGEWVASQVGSVDRGPRAAERVAAIDQGTNSIRLLVGEPDGDVGAESDPSQPFVELARDMVITRLGKGVDETGMLDAEALARTVEVLARYCRRARALGATRIRVCATSAVRDAANRDEFAQAVRREAGSELEVISGETEAALSFLGGTIGLDSPQWVDTGVEAPYMVLDIGGGSTEFVVGERAGVAGASISTQMGSVRLTERLIAHDPATPDELDALEREIDSVIDGVLAEVPELRDARTLVAVAGTATTLQAIAMDLRVYDPDVTQRTWLSLETAEAVVGRLCRMTNAEKAAIPVMAPGRGDVIVAGGVILSKVMRRLGFDRALVSETDILDGSLVEMLRVR